MDRSLFQYISEAVDSDGKLPSGFSLPPMEDEKMAIFADGAMDGINIYHMGFSPMSEEEEQELLKLLITANDGDIDKATSGFASFCKKNRAVTIIDDVQDAILNNQDDLSVQNMVRFAFHLLTETSDRECVKIGLIILELVDTSKDPDLMTVIRTMGLSDEFTLFTVFIMRHWSDGQMEILDLAKRVHGWGRIHCVSFIEPENDEIKKWLLLHGVDNSVLPDYSALKVFNKAGVEELLDRKDLSLEEIKGILKIMDAMLDEGPVAGISALDSPEPVLAKVMAVANACSGLDEEDMKIVSRIEEYKPEE
ncbi:hypothetical protein [Butyrivibrio sp. AE2032]|uniref:hypothetical protein n=1 Tax=Butyrivibrio sp. AE2032 TaxID=1458463 RepID=UPI00055888DF|nr:hypothetical protein [Butyrivibrio sp. AE2032]